MSDKIIIRRGIFAKFLPDNETIRIFERLFSATNELLSKIWRTDVSTPIVGDTELTAVSQTILVDCTSGDINITLPPPADMVNSSGYSNEIAITKIDTTSNRVAILPNINEEVVNNIYQDLIFSGEVINLVTDGTNWHLGA